mgnify:CR=1 FL=1
MTQNLFDLTGRTALVTGSSRGLGRAIAEGLAKAGARLVVNGVDPARLEAAVAELRAAGYQAEGAAFEDWRIKEITADAVTLTKGRETRVVRVFG